MSPFNGCPCSIIDGEPQIEGSGLMSQKVMASKKLATIRNISKLEKNNPMDYINERFPLNLKGYDVGACH